ncbi:MAG TPA: helix-turn-helix domain-containing protein [Candidatus Omnitrophota bacterium]|nr:helix-turn-helix domain-containing protein [Candidatus Omnitrophota bacterium]
MEKKYLNIDELSEYINLKKRTLYSLTFQNKIPCVRVGGKILRFDVEKIDAWMSQQANDPSKNKY